MVPGHFVRFMSNLVLILAHFNQICHKIVRSVRRNPIEFTRALVQASTA